MREIQFDTLSDGLRLAFLEEAGDPASCGFFWLGGFKSEMTGGKAESLAALARREGRAFLRFDYSGHGASGGRFEDGTITAWASQARHVFEQSQGPRIVVGSSMGGWLALLLLRQLMEEDPAQAARIKGLVLIAPAADMTADLMWDEFSAEARQKLVRDGVYHRPSSYGEPYPITMLLIEDGRRHLLLHKGLDCPCPVRILQGDQDADVPAPHAVRLFEALRGSDIRLTLIKGGDHRLSQPPQLELIGETALRLAQQADRVSP
jgi:pimeloyl-ACP methyl ester carboxylesterase